MARHAFDKLDGIHKSSIDLAASKLRSVFTFTRKQQWLAQLGDAKYEPDDETFQLFGVRIGRLNRKAYPELAESPHLEMLCVQSFIAGLPSDLRKVVGSQEPTTIDEAIIVAEKHDAMVKLTGRWDPKRVSNKSNLTLMDTNEPTADQVELIDKVHGGKQSITLCSLQQNLNNINKQQHQKLGEISKTLAELTKTSQQLPPVVESAAPRTYTAPLYNPYRTDNRHSSRQQSYSNSHRKPYDRNNNRFLCWNCGEEGHAQIRCPKLQPRFVRQPVPHANGETPPTGIQTRPTTSKVALNH